MRHIKLSLVIFVGFFLVANINASGDTASKNQPIPVNNGNWRPGTRSLSSQPELYQNGDTIFIDSECTLSNLNITIEDLSNNIIQSSTITVLGGEEYSYIVYANPGTYKVTLTQGSKSLYGYFTIEE
jgi:hypothetical protein